MMHSLTLEAIFRQLHASIDGITTDAAALRFGLAALRFVSPLSAFDTPFPEASHAKPTRAR